MLYPAMSDLLKKVDNRYKLVNVTAKRARDVAQRAEEEGRTLNKKAVSIALDEIDEGKVEVLERGEQIDFEETEEIFFEEEIE